MSAIQVSRATEHDLPVPARESADAAGYDLRSTLKWMLYPGEQKAIPTGFAWAIPIGFAGLIRDRSGLAVRSRVTTVAGVIDSDYRGEVCAVLANHGDQPLDIEIGTRIAQMVIVACLQSPCVETGALPETARGSGGFGSTGR